MKSRLASSLMLVATGLFLSVPTSLAQQKNRRPVIVQPGAPGSPTRELPATTRAELPPVSAADVQFMQGMIVHHAQAVEMTDLIESHTDNAGVRALGARISRSQSDEIAFMKRWLAARGQSMTIAAAEMHHMHHNMHNSRNGTSHEAGALMPGMLTPQQMEALRRSRGAEFDRLFLSGMIRHHGGALDMVRDLFAAAGAGQEAELFTFATDVDSGQRAEIRVMQNMLEKINSKEKR